MVGDDVLWCPEQEASLGGGDHGQVVEGVPGGDGVVAHGLEALDGMEFAIVLPHLVVHNLSVGSHHQLVAEDSGHSQLFHQGGGELGEGVREDHHLGHPPQLVQEFLCSRKRVDAGDGGLNCLEPQLVLLQDGQPLLHQHVVVADVPGGEPQLRDASGLGKGNPDLRHQNALQIKAGYIHINSSCSSLAPGRGSLESEKSLPLYHKARGIDSARTPVFLAQAVLYFMVKSVP